MENNWYIVNDLDDFIDHTRILVFNNFGSQITDHPEDQLLLDLTEEQEEELNSILTHEESMVIAKNFVKKQIHKHTKNIRYVISDDIFMDIVSSLNDRLISNLIHSLVRKGFLETAFDTDANDFVFWVKKHENHTNTDEEKPETD